MCRCGGGYSIWRKSKKTRKFQKLARHPREWVGGWGGSLLPDGNDYHLYPPTSLFLNDNVDSNHYHLHLESARWGIVPSYNLLHTVTKYYKKGLALNIHYDIITIWQSNPADPYKLGEYHGIN